MLQVIELRTMKPPPTGPLSDFFESLRSSRDDLQFHPHPLTREEAERRTRYNAADLYYVLVDGERVLGYGMLRGWDEGYDVPSLGIAIHPDERGRGLGKFMMAFLHEAARRRGAEHVRLTVNADNKIAVRLYRELGYTIRDMGDGRLEGLLRL